MAKIALLICLVATMAAIAFSQGNSGAAKSAQAQASQPIVIKPLPWSDSSCCCYYTCPSGWTRFQNRCYKFNGTLESHPGAERSCNQHYSFYDAFTGFTIGGEAHLASINSEGEQYFVFYLWQDSLLWPHDLADGSK